MLKGYIFKEQTFNNEVCALIFNEYLNNIDGIFGNYKNAMEVTKSGSNVTIASGVGIIKGRAVGEDSTTTLDAGTTDMYCKLVIEIDLDKVNTSSSFLQASYKILKSASAYPSLTQDNIIGTNSGIYQFELARFRTDTNGITDFEDMRTFIDIPTMYEQVVEMVQEAIDSIEDGSAFATKEEFNRKGTIEILATLKSGTSATKTVSDLSQYSLLILQCCYVGDINHVLASTAGTYNQFKNSSGKWECIFEDGTNYDIAAKYISDTKITLERKGTYDTAVLLGIKK